MFGENFLLSTETARVLYHECAKHQPIIDYHCHISPREIAQDIRFENITQLWLGSDHYKWRLMRADGVSERLITGSASDREKFFAWAKALGRAIGNPLYAWSHLELKNNFGFEGVLCEQSAEEVWELCNTKLAQPEYSARGFIKRSSVELICTTDDPADNLNWHRELALDKSFTVKVLPTWRPDRVLQANNRDFCDYIKKLGQSENMRVNSFEELKTLLKNRLDFFAQNGCKLSDHGLAYIPFSPCSDARVEELLKKRLSGEMLDKAELEQWQTALLQYLGRKYAELGWTMQLHMGVMRDCRSRLFYCVGADCGCDGIGRQIDGAQLSAFLNSLDMDGCLPKTILYSLNPGDNALLTSICGHFQCSPVRSKLQHGSAWWLNDHHDGMREQLKNLANAGMLANFVGMLTDSRSFLSYARHEYFRRILCSQIGQWVESGEFASDVGTLKGIVTGICHDNAIEYFDFN